MSRQLATASAFSVLALFALALFAPAIDRAPAHNGTGAASVIAAPALTVVLDLLD